jgi:DNA helicase-2/ATP-dependent DNA helicase PcrA
MDGRLRAECRRWLHAVRPRHRLHLITPHRFFTHGQPSLGDRHVYSSRSRFIPASLLPLFETVTWPILATQLARQAAIAQVRIDVGARMRSMWR